MSDNVAITPGTGATIACDEVTDATLGTVKVQIVKVMDGTLDSTNKLKVSSAGSVAAQITDGTNAAAIKAASTAPIATDPALVVAISPNSVNANGRAVPGSSAPVVVASQTYETVAASQTAQIMGGSGATGDYIDSILVIPATTSPGNVLLLDNATSITVFTGGATSVSNLVPFIIQLGMISASGAWKITTGANVSCIGIGNFT